MSIQTTDTVSDVTSDSTRELGKVSISDNYQDEYLPLILNELRRISLLIAEMSMQRIDFNEVIEPRGDY